MVAQIDADEVSAIDLTPLIVRILQLFTTAGQSNSVDSIVQGWIEQGGTQKRNSGWRRVSTLLGPTHLTSKAG